MDENENWILWYSLDSKLTAPKDAVERLREIDPRARVPRKTIEDNHLSNLNIRAALREFIEDILKGVRLAPKTYFIRCEQYEISSLHTIMTEIGCDVGVIKVKNLLDDGLTSGTIGNGYINKWDELYVSLIEAVKHYHSKPTASKSLKVLDVHNEIVKLETEACEIFKTGFWYHIDEETEQLVKELEEMHNVT